MKKIKTTVTAVNDTATIARRNHKNSTYLSLGKNVVVRSRSVRPIDSCNAYICVSKTLRATLDDKYCTLVNPVNGAFVDVIVHEVEGLEENGVDITKFVSGALEAVDSTQLIICKQNYHKYNAVKLQTFANIKDDIVVLPKDAYAENMAKEFCLFEVINPLTNDSIYVRSKHIEFDNTLKPNEIRLNKKQRNMLSDNIPTRLSTTQFEELLKCEKVNSEILSGAYNQDSNGYTLAKAVI